ncbi:hypothetical protein RJ639_011854 [Escallonia herrerae]|uniref:Uncharacterized protein n=1 Tax=Escallonia herrerae TaxID=1293975 RepID=A0AA88VMS3_9ASTE|nr:hypothetical protein RJ639_011854 [Escallonia herrerae]
MSSTSRAWVVAASIAAVEALKDQGFCRWNYALRSIHQHAKTNIRSYSQARRLCAPSTAVMAGEEKVKRSEESLRKISMNNPSYNNSQEAKPRSEGVVEGEPAGAPEKLPTSGCQLSILNTTKSPPVPAVSETSTHHSVVGENDVPSPAQILKRQTMGSALVKQNFTTSRALNS